MKIKTISYSLSQESIDQTGLKSWKKCGIEVELDQPEDTEEKAFAHAKEIIAERMNAGDMPPVWAFTSEHIPATQPIINRAAERHSLDRTNAIIFDIESVKELKVLESYKLIAKSHPDIQTAYDNQYKLLSQ